MKIHICSFHITHLFTLTESPVLNPLSFWGCFAPSEENDSPAEQLPPDTAVISIRSRTFNTETKLKYYMFVCFAWQQRRGKKNEALYYHNHVFGVWSESAAKWGRLVCSHPLQNTSRFVFLHFFSGTLIQHVLNWLKWNGSVERAIFVLANSSKRFFLVLTPVKKS